MQPDLIALVIELEALMPTHISNYMGRAVQFAALTLIGGSDPALAQTLHDDDKPKPFTTSGLMRGDIPLYGDVNVGDRAWIRITGLSADVVAALMAACDGGPDAARDAAPDAISINRQMWRVVGFHPETSSYQRLIERHAGRHAGAHPDHRIDMRFITPTTFKSAGMNVPLPLPALVFDSLLLRWMAFTSHRLRDLPGDQMAAYLAHHIVISRHDIRTAMVRGKGGGKEIGFYGDVSFELLRRSDHLKKQDAALENLLQAEGVWFARTANLLAEFALYSGVGRKTTTGMGVISV